MLRVSHVPQGPQGEGGHHAERPRIERVVGEVTDVVQHEAKPRDERRQRRLRQKLRVEQLFEVCAQLAQIADRCPQVTAPREIVPGRTYLVTRRCTQRQFLLKPSARTNELAGYCLALAAQHTGVLLHAVCFLSNHWHGVVTDPLARLPEFLERFHRLFARAQNARPPPVSFGHQASGPA